MKVAFQSRPLLANTAFCVICNVKPSLLFSTTHHQGGLLPLALLLTLPPLSATAVHKGPSWCRRGILVAFTEFWQHSIFFLLLSMWLLLSFSCIWQSLCEFQSPLITFFSKFHWELEFPVAFMISRRGQEM